jgi:hypothetical protein
MYKLFWKKFYVEQNCVDDLFQPEKFVVKESKHYSIPMSAMDKGYNIRGHSFTSVLEEAA